MNILAALLVNPFVSAINKAVRKGNEQRALSFARSYQRLFPRDPRGPWLEYQIHTEFGSGDDGSILEILRKGWSRSPYASFLACALSTKLLMDYDESGDIRYREEGVEVITQFESLMGPSSWCCVNRGFLAQAEGETDEASRQMALAGELLRQEEFDGRTSVWVATGFLHTGDRAEAIRLFIEICSKVAEPWPYIYLSLVNEQREPDLARGYLETARRLWGGPPSSFERSVQDARDSLIEDEAKYGLEVF